MIPLWRIICLGWLSLSSEFSHHATTSLANIISLAQNMHTKSQKKRYPRTMFWWSTSGLNMQLVFLKADCTHQNTCSFKFQMNSLTNLSHTRLLHEDLHFYDAVWEWRARGCRLWFWASVYIAEADAPVQLLNFLKINKHWYVNLNNI